MNLGSGLPRCSACCGSVHPIEPYPRMYAVCKDGSSVFYGAEFLRQLHWNTAF